jgi:hypothetical protein
MRGWGGVDQRSSGASHESETDSHVYMNLTVAPGHSAQSQYYGVIRSLRNAAGHPCRNNVEMTQLDDIHALSGST